MIELISVRRAGQMSLFAISFALPAVAAAQDSGESAPDEQASDSELIIVTASRRAVSLQDTPLSVTSIDPSELETSGEGSLREVIEYAPGVNFSGGATPVSNTITMRGVAQIGRASTVGVYVDDVPIGSSNSFAGGPSIQFDGVQGDIERIELVRGPQGTLYGSSAMGGVVRYITRDPSRDDLSLKLRGEAAFVRQGTPGLSLSGRVAAPIAKDVLGVSVSGYYDAFGGFIDRTASSPTGADKNVDSYDRYGVMTKAALRPLDGVKVDLMYIHTDAKATGANQVALAGPPFVPIDGPFSTDQGAGQMHDTFDLVSGSFNIDLGVGTLISSTSWQKRENSNSSDLVATFGTLVDLLSGQPFGTTTSAPFTGLLRTERFVQEVRIESNESDTFEWSIGGIYSDEDSDNIQRLLGNPGNFVALDVNLGSELVEYAGFGNARIYLSQEFDLGVGFRLSHVESSISLIDGPKLIVADVPETTKTDTVETYSVTARYRPNPDLSLYARVASGYRPSNANLPLLDVNGNNAAPALIESDTLWSYELGAKGSLADGYISYDLSAWYIDWKNLQVVTFVNGASTGGNANSDVTAYGFEAALAARPTDGLNINASLSYAHSTLDDDETAAFGGLAGERLPQLPRWTASIRANYEFPLSDEVDGFVGAGVRYTGARNTGFEGGVGESGATITPLIANFTLDEMVVANINAGIKSGPITASFFVNNLLDEYGFTGGSARPIVGGVRATANVLQPRTVGMSVTFDY